MFLASVWYNQGPEGREKVLVNLHDLKKIECNDSVKPLMVFIEIFSLLLFLD